MTGKQIFLVNVQDRPVFNDTEMLNCTVQVKFQNYCV